MIVKVIDPDGIITVVPGPPDLQQYGNGFHLCVIGEPSEMDKATWGFQIGMFIMRKGTA
jgi:hypothetical protein